MKTGKWIVLVSVAAGVGFALLRASDNRAQRRQYSRRDESFTDINSAGPDELQKLGLDSVAAERIVENRPYRNKLELVSRMVLPEKLYGSIRHRIGVRDAADGVKVA